MCQENEVKSFFFLIFFLYLPSLLCDSGEEKCINMQKIEFIIPFNCMFIQFEEGVYTFMD